MKTFITGLILVLASSFAQAATLDAKAVGEVAMKYRALVEQSYKTLLEQNKNLDQVARAFVQNPTADGLEKTREAWKQARLAYSPTEAFRFYGGPIDEADKGAEPLLNAWPIDEAYLDVVKGGKDAGLIGNKKDYPVLDAKTLIAANEKGGERNVSTGYHAIEFVLWGQDFSTTGPGERTVREFQTKDLLGKRRGEMLVALTGLLVTHTEELLKAWDPKAPYVQTFLAEKPDEILRRVFVGVTSLSADEMAGERLTVALEKNDPEHEQDCFSDFTLEDMKANQKGIETVLTQIGLENLLDKAQKKDFEVLKKDLKKTMADISKIPAPLDKLLLDKKNKDRKKIEVTIASLQKQARQVDKLVKKWGLELNVQSE